MMIENERHCLYELFFMIGENIEWNFVSDECHCARIKITHFNENEWIKKVKSKKVLIFPIYQRVKTQYRCLLKIDKHLRNGF